MNACILGLFRDSVDTSQVEFKTETNSETGIIVEENVYLDDLDATIYSGTAAGYADTTQTEVYVHDNSITTEQVAGQKHLAADYYVDFDTGWAGIETGDAEFIWSRLAIEAGVDIERATINLDEFARDYQQRDDAHVWQLGRDEADADPDSDDEGVTIAYHDDATVREAAQGGVSQIGVSYRWGDQYVYGTVAASGYVAVYSTMTTAAFGRWLRDELLPYASLPDTAQSLFENATSNDAEVCDECEREPERGFEQVGGDDLCIVCADARDNQTSSGFENLDSVTVTDGGNDE
jgi:hypothetical protein